jgi:hypothetical protein
MNVRAAAACMLALGIGVGTAADDVPRRTPIRSGADWLLACDFHVHAFPGDGSLTPFSLRDEAARAGIDVIAITNHNQFAAARLIRWLPADPGAPILIPGEEITHPDYHLIAVGIDRRIAAGPPVAELARAIHDAGGVAIAAHPSRAFRGYDERALAAVDGVEVARADNREQDRRDYVAAFEHARRLNPHVAPIGSSDMHNSLGLGSSRTFVFARERTPAGVLDAIRAGRTVAEDDRGQMFGNPDLVARVRAAAPPGRGDPHRWARRLAIVMAFIGVAGLVVA